MSGAEATKTVKESRVVLAQHMGVSDSNLAGAVHGGTIMKLVDTAGGLAAMKFSGCPVVTAAIDELSFLEPVNLGDLVTVTASVNGVGDTSMEVGVKVETENVLTGETRHTSTAYLLYVALDAETKQPVRVPRLDCETAEERRRQRQAKARRKARTARREATLAGPGSPAKAGSRRGAAPGATGRKEGRNAIRPFRGAGGLCSDRFGWRSEEVAPPGIGTRAGPCRRNHVVLRAGGRPEQMEKAHPLVSQPRPVKHRLSGVAASVQVRVSRQERGGSDDAGRSY
jgi:acyl-CoA hydrolase